MLTEAISGGMAPTEEALAAAPSAKASESAANTAALGPKAVLCHEAAIVFFHLYPWALPLCNRTQECGGVRRGRQNGWKSERSLLLGI